MKRLSETDVLKRYSQPPGDPPVTSNKAPSGSIAIFPTSPLDMPSETFESALKRREKNHRLLIDWIKKNLKPNIDYGRSHIEENCRYARIGAAHLCSDFSHMSMITLWKSGAEKICRLLGLSAHFPNVHDYVLASLHRQRFKVVVLKCELKTNNGAVVAEGSGARNIKQDGWNVNTSIKMAAKSAMVDATIRVAGLSGIFIKTHRHTLTGMKACNDDKVTGIRSSNVKEMRQKPHGVRYISQPQEDLILKLAGRFWITIETLNKRCKDTFGSTLKGLERHHASRLISQLNGQSSAQNQQYK